MRHFKILVFVTALFSEASYSEIDCMNLNDEIHTIKMVPSCVARIAKFKDPRSAQVLLEYVLHNDKATEEQKAKILSNLKSILKPKYFLYYSALIELGPRKYEKLLLSAQLGNPEAAVLLATSVNDLSKQEKISYLKFAADEKDFLGAFLYSAHLLSTTDNSVKNDEILKYLRIAANGGSERAVSSLLENSDRLSLKKSEITFWKFIEIIYSNGDIVSLGLDETGLAISDFCELLLENHRAVLNSPLTIDSPNLQKVDEFILMCAIR